MIERISDNTGIEDQILLDPEEELDIDAQLKGVSFPSDDEIQAVAEGKAIFYVRKPAFVMTVARVWGEVLKKTGSWTPEAVDEVLNKGFQGLMGNVSEPQLVSRAVEGPILEIARYRMHVNH